MLNLFVGSAMAITVFISFFAWIGSLATYNYSIIDRLWSILPPLFVIVLTQQFADSLEFKNPLLLFAQYPKLFIMFILPILWGVRLTCNFARKGGYSATNEDYRWEYLRNKFQSEALFQILNVTFISTYQTFVLYLIVHPMHLVVNVLQLQPNHRIGQLSMLDIAATGAFLLTLYLEYLSDEQQWVFYSERAEYNKLKGVKKSSTHFTFPLKVLKQGFNSVGLFSFSRHPNFLAEISLWFIYAFFALNYSFIDPRFYIATAADSSFIDMLLHPFTVFLGAFLLWGIFQGSVPFTEHITAEKYPKYKEYQQNVPRLIPNPLRVIKAIFQDQSENSEDDLQKV